MEPPMISFYKDLEACAPSDCWLPQSYQTSIDKEFRDWGPTLTIHEHDDGDAPRDDVGNEKWISKHRFGRAFCFRFPQ
jgi:hypothetical protein